MARSLYVELVHRLGARGAPRRSLVSLQSGIGRLEAFVAGSWVVVQSCTCVCHSGGTACSGASRARWYYHHHPRWEWKLCRVRRRRYPRWARRGELSGRGAQNCSNAACMQACEYWRASEVAAACPAGPITAVTRTAAEINGERSCARDRIRRH
eukprot:SAG11_NODE_3180_length_2628_cov_7.505733_2_plen_154_part_00